MKNKINQNFLLLIVLNLDFCISASAVDQEYLLSAKTIRDIYNNQIENSSKVEGFDGYRNPNEYWNIDDAIIEVDEIIYGIGEAHEETFMGEGLFIVLFIAIIYFVFVHWRTKKKKT